MRDQLNNIINLKQYPKRIVSLVPSQTEYLFDLGLNDEIVGITKFCIHPLHWHQTKNKIGGTKNIHIEKIKSLNPDLVIANKEENLKSEIEEIQKFCPVWVSDINTYSEAIEMMKTISDITGKEEIGNRIVDEIERRKNSYINQRKKELKKAIYFIWRNPYMVVGNETFIDEMMSIAGFENLINHQIRYPEIEKNELIKLNPEYILLSSEPYPFKEKHAEELSEFLPNAKIILVDGELFSWYGSRMLKSFDYFSTLHESL